MGKDIVVLPGDGVGSEVIDSCVEVLQATCPDIRIHYGEIGYRCYREHGVPVTEDTLGLIKKYRVVLLGAVESARHGEYRAIIPRIRRWFDLYLSLIHI